MPKITIHQAKEAIENNKSFFTMPLTDQTKFGQIYQDSGAIEAITSYSRDLQKLLYSKQTRLSAESTTPVIYAWRKGDFSAAIQHEEVRNFIVDNLDHPALLVFNIENVKFQFLFK